ncbi:LCP family protein [Nocardiopsis gilva]|uniref:LCP family protein n=1 Tax=Nocardiopsis gilva TaxID=280236 RepID=UPI00034D39D4|nr:LCP family protein [Nocardiopsis gilva]
MSRSLPTRKRLSPSAWIAVITTGVVIGSSLTAYAAYVDITGGINRENVNTDAFGDRPSKVEGVVNIMIVGSDKRDGANAEYGDAEGERPDTLAIAHISPKKKSATIVNLPRDSIVQLPACKQKGDEYPGSDAQQGMINSAMSYGGVDCQWDTVEKLTDIRIDHFVSVDFTGFKGMVDALGGVEMCIPQKIHDPKAGGLELDAGKQTLNGEDALGYVRSRKGQGDGSDLMRIGRQQEFMASMVRKVLSGDTLKSPSNLYAFLNEVTGSITTDDELTVDTMADIAIAMREVDLNDVNFVTVPNHPWEQNNNRVAWDEPDAQQLFQAIATDEYGGEKDKASSDDSGDDAKDVKPGDVSVEVLNGTGMTNLATQVSGILSERGFGVSGTGNPQGIVPEASTIYHGPDGKAAAELLAKEVTNATLQEDSSLSGNSLRLVMSRDWNGFKTAGATGDVPDTVKSKSAASKPSAC